MNKMITPSFPSSACITLGSLVCLFPPMLNAADSTSARTAIVRVADLDVNEAQEIEFANGSKVRVKLLRLDETRDALRDAVRQSFATPEQRHK